MSELEKAVRALINRAEINPTIRSVSKEIHDIFEEVLTVAILENPGKDIDGAAILVTCMKIFREITDTDIPTPHTTLGAGLPSERYGRNPAN